MSVYHHIDRLGTLRPDSTISLTRYNDINPEDLQQHVDLLFPEGVSNHGEHYFLKADTRARAVDPVIELLFEYVRRSFYTDKPSRFQSFFAFGSREDARIFMERYCNSRCTIWRVECDESRAFKADMNILTLIDSLLVTSYRAHCYWQGLPDPGGDSPLWEFLLSPPVKVLERLQTHEN